MELFARVYLALHFSMAVTTEYSKLQFRLLSRAVSAEAHISEFGAGWEAYVLSTRMHAREMVTCLAARAPRRENLYAGKCSVYAVTCGDAARWTFVRPFQLT